MSWIVRDLWKTLETRRGEYSILLAENLLQEIGHRDLSMLIHRDRKEFQNVSEDEVKQAFKSLNPLSFDSAGFGYQGFRVRLSSGRIDCLPGGVHLWCEISPEVLNVLDWLFTKAYGMRPIVD